MFRLAGVLAIAALALTFATSTASQDHVPEPREESDESLPLPLSVVQEGELLPGVLQPPLVPPAVPATSAPAVAELEKGTPMSNYGSLVALLKRTADSAAGVASNGLSAVKRGIGQVIGGVQSKLRKEPESSQHEAAIDVEAA